MELVGRIVTTGRLEHHEAKSAVCTVRKFLRAHDAGEIAERMEVLEDKIARIKAGDLEVVK